VRFLLPAFLLFGCSGASEAEERPPIHVMTALPLFWGEGTPVDIIQGEQGRSPLLVALDAHYTVIAIDIASDAALARASTLVLAQPTALRPEELVAIDDWVRSGGRVLVFADPSLAWPSDLPMGDKRRPPPQSLLVPLLTHWGLTLEAPEANTVSIVKDRIDGRPVAFALPGTWEAKTRDCKLSDKGVVARCSIGKGEAVLVADADLLDARLWNQSGIDNRAAIVGLIDDLRVAR
jgi:hypothetical protein